MNTSHSSRILYLEGLRGIAALMVFFYHIINSLYPMLGIGKSYDLTDKIQLGKQIYFLSTPIALIWSGDFAVSIFFVLSGYVLSYQYFQQSNIKIIYEKAIKRYFRLMVPILISVLVAYLFQRLGLFYNLQASEITGSEQWLKKTYDFDPDFWQAFYQGLYGILFKGQASYNHILWTMKPELFGSLLALSLSPFIMYIAKKGWWPNTIIFYLALLFSSYSNHYFCFIVGVLLSHSNLWVTKLAKSQLITCFSIILFILAMYLGAYPVNGLLENFWGKIYKLMQFETIGLNQYNSPYFYHRMAAPLLMISILLNKKLQHFLSLKPLVYLGKISFPFYLFHLIIICSLTCKLVLVLNFLPYNMACLINSLITLICVVVCSHYLAIADGYYLVLLKKLYNYYEQKLILQYKLSQDITHTTPEEVSK